MRIKSMTTKELLEALNTRWVSEREKVRIAIRLARIEPGRKLIEEAKKAFGIDRAKH
jgi:hypothetical protein